MNENPEKIRQILAQNIKKRRDILGLSQEKLAEITDLSVQTINTIEGCRMWVSDKTVSQLAKALKIEVFQLFVPYQTDKSSHNTAQLVLDLRSNVIDEIEKLNSKIDRKFTDALKKS